MAVQWVGRVFAQNGNCGASGENCSLGEFNLDTGSQYTAQAYDISVRSLRPDSIINDHAQTLTLRISEYPRLHAVHADRCGGVRGSDVHERQLWVHECVPARRSLWLWRRLPCEGLRPGRHCFHQSVGFIDLMSSSVADCCLSHLLPMISASFSIAAFFGRAMLYMRNISFVNSSLRA